MCGMSVVPGMVAGCKQAGSPDTLGGGGSCRRGVWCRCGDDQQVWGRPGRRGRYPGRSTPPRVSLAVSLSPTTAAAADNR